MMTGTDSLALEPEATYPFVPGHEIVGEIETPPVAGVASPGGDLAPGRRVAVWPVLGCRARGLEPCDACRAGWDGLCTRRGEGWPGAGLATGFNRDTGGGWSEACLVHESQVWPVGETVTDRDAVVLDAAAAPLAALLRTNVPRPERTLIVGGGTIGLLCGYLDRALHLSDSCELLVHHGFQRRWAEDRGVPASIVRTDAEFRDWAAGRSIAAKRVEGYGYVFRGSYDRAVVAASSERALGWALAAVRPRGVVALVAAPPALRRLDPTSVWYREVTVRGIYAYGPVPWEGRWLHPYAVLLPLIEAGTLALRHAVTHEFALEEYVAAFAAISGRSSSGAIKVVFRPQADP